MRIALVYDRVNKYGGAEAVLLTLHRMFPDAPLFTSVYNKKKAPWAHVFHVIPTFLSSLFFARSHHEFFPWATPIAFESMNFDNYDIVISITSAEAKTIITKPETLHICYCLTPTRYLWSGYEKYKKNPGFGVLSKFASIIFSKTVSVLRRWDMIGAKRPDRYVAISYRVKKRIETYYKRSVDMVIYPPVQTVLFNKQAHDSYSPLPFPANSYYLCVSRLVPYKRVDIVVSACTELGRPLIVIGEGSELSRLKKIAGQTVRFIDRHLTDRELVRYHQNCRAFLFAGDEDFGIVAVEAQASGKPVICYSESGLAEIIQDGKTGVLFHFQTKESLILAIKLFESKTHIDSQVCKENAKRFCEEIFIKQFGEYVKKTYLEYFKQL